MEGFTDQETRGGSSKDFIAQLQSADLLIGHNIQSFDLPALKKVYTNFKAPNIFDTLIVSRVLYTNLKQLDFTRWRNRNLGKDVGSHSLRAWGKRLGTYKGDYEGGFDQYCPEMYDYCLQDVVVNTQLYHHLKLEMSKRLRKLDCIKLEHEFADYIDLQNKTGCHFNMAKAEPLRAKVEAHLEIVGAQIQRRIPAQKIPYIPKANNARYGNVKGVLKYKEKLFNPNSRPQITKFLIDKYEWEPEILTDKGNPKLTADILAGLPYEEAPIFGDFLSHKKLISQLSTGAKSWLSFVEDGKIYGYCNHNGAATHRCTHRNPNFAQVPTARKVFGKECRELFHAPEGYMVVGADASGLELRMLAHYLSSIDGGEFRTTLLEGDIHTKNQGDAGLPNRDSAKTFIYAFNYGAGDEKLGSIVFASASSARKKEHGKLLRRKFLAKNPAIGQLVSNLKDVVSKRGYLYALDGRTIPVDSPHKCLNRLLQTAGAIVMKKATVIARGLLDEKEIDWMPMLHVHDEMQICVANKDVTLAGEILVTAIREAGVELDLALPLDGEYKVGESWADTH